MIKRRDVRRSGAVWTVIEGVEIPLREVKVAGEWIEAPRHINRIDIDSKKTHGWQVRYRGQSSFFSDIRNKSKDRRQSLEDAKVYLQNIYKDDLHIHKYDFPSQEHKDKELKLYPGVSGLWRRAPTREMYEFYFQVIVPVYGPNRHRNIKLYACTETTLDKKIVNDRARKAIAIRRYFEDLYSKKDVETAKVLTLKKMDGIDVTPFERKFPPITRKKLVEMLEKARLKWG